MKTLTANVGLPVLESREIIPLLLVPPHHSLVQPIIIRVPSASYEYKWTEARGHLYTLSLYKSLPKVFSNERLTRKKNNHPCWRGADWEKIVFTFEARVMILPEEPCSVKVCVYQPCTIWIFEQLTLPITLNWKHKNWQITILLFPK